MERSTSESSLSVWVSWPNATTVRRLAEAKKMKTEQKTEYETFEELPS